MNLFKSFRNLALAGIAVLAFFQAAQAQNYQLHSVYLYSFTRYVQWPDEAGKGDFVIDVLGESPIYEELVKMAESKKVGDRTIKVNQIKSVAQARKCNILFIPAGKSAALQEVVGKFENDPVLLVTEQDGLASKGSAINFVLKDGKLAFELNQLTLTKHKLKASSELTRLAIIL